MTRKLREYAMAALLMGACGSSERHTHSHSPMSVDRHMDDADEHDRAAEVDEARYRPEEGRGANYQCEDRRLTTEPISGGESIPIGKPCWLSEKNPTAEFLAAASKNHTAAADHRKRASELARAEREACEEIGEDELSHSPFYHRDDIISVEAIREGGAVVGVRTHFRRVPGLTRTWMAQSVACHQARAAATGFDTTYMAYCPLMLRGIAAAVTETDGAIVVSLRSDDEVSAAAALGRAQDLLPAAK